jgi:tetratricopeptide (TPR) repeat protein
LQSNKLILFFLLISFASVSRGQNAKQHFKAGEQFFENGLVDAAIEEFEKSILLDPDDGRTYYFLAEANLIKGDTLLAADQYRRAGALGFDSPRSYLIAAKYFNENGKIQEAFECVNAGLEAKPKDIDLLVLKTAMYFADEKYHEAYNVSHEALKSKDLAIVYYYAGVSAYHLDLIPEAEKNLEKAIIRDRNLSEAYLAIAEMQIDQEKFDYAIDNCSLVLLLMDPESINALVLRSRAFRGLNEPEDAIADITKAIGLTENDYHLILERAQINLDYALYADAIHDYTIALQMNDTSVSSLKSRAYANEQLGENNKALEDYTSLLALIEGEFKYTQLESFATSRIYELGKETIKPIITIETPVINENLELTVVEGQEEITISGNVIEASELREVRVNNNHIQFQKTSDGEYTFTYKMATENLDFVSVTAVDIYENLSTASFPIAYVETNAPVIELLSPIAGTAGIIQIETGDNALYIEGRIIDKSYITSIKIDEVNASFTPGDYNPKFTATIDINNRNNITVTATDAFGNVATRTFEFAQDGQLLSENNPMGKTWVVIIENSDYREYTNLTGPAQDIKLLDEALKRYQVSKVLHKKNMTKRELERFFAIDLRDLIISNQVNSLLIWYAGHGQTISNSGYWIPVDGRQNDEYSFYNINALKASLYSYQSLTHILVVSDACYAGESFTIAMRGSNNSLATCNDLNLITQKSALVLTSSNRESALDNSLFTRTFANALANNPADCIPIDAIAERVTIVLNKNSGQKPVFGRIAGLEDKNGTFFFVTK